MPKKYKYVNGKKMIVVNNYDLGTDIIPEEEQIVPDPLVTDVGKVLTVNQAGNPAWEDAPEELPALTGNAGKVLKVASGASGVEWADETSELPAVTSADEGDVLTVNASGEWEAAAPGGGGVVFCTFDLTDIKTGNYGPYAESDITIEAIYNAILSGKTVYAKFAGENTYNIPEAVSVVYGVSYYWDELSPYYDTYHFVNEDSNYLCMPPHNIISFGISDTGKIDAYIYTD